MVVSIYNCWFCEKPLAQSKPKLKGKKRAKTPFSVTTFYCDTSCKSKYDRALEEVQRPYRQWSDYMCGEREKPPRKLKELAKKIGWPKDLVTEEDTEDTPVVKSSGRKCGKCGERGHNARTCGTQKQTPEKKAVAKAISAPPKRVMKKSRGKKAQPKRRVISKKKAAKQRQYRCGLCDRAGHNARSCDRRPLEPGEFEPKLLKASKVGKYKCGKCHQIGHNARTCVESNRK